MEPTLRVQSKKAFDGFQRMPDQIRLNLRRVVPDLTKRLGARVEARLDSGLQSRRRLKVVKEVREDSKSVYGQVRVVWTGETQKNFIPQILDTGSKAHAIVAKNAKALSFLWPKMGGGRFFFKQVWHPGFAGINYMQGAFLEMQSEIESSIREAVESATRDWEFNDIVG